MDHVRFRQRRGKFIVIKWRRNDYNFVNYTVVLGLAIDKRCEELASNIHARAASFPQGCTRGLFKLVIICWRMEHSKV